MFTLKNITKHFGSEVALSNVSLEITGGLNYIIGASGSGKTTLLRILSGMDTNYEGTATYYGKDMKALTHEESAALYASELGFIAQSFHLLSEFTVRENILLPTFLDCKSKEKEYKTLLKRLNIENIENQKVSTLSGGQKQRVAIARELMKNPKVLVADEPTAALDEITAKEIINILSTIAKDRTVVVVTHDTSLIKPDSSVFELDKGMLVRCEPVASKQKERKLDLKKPSISMKNAFSLAGLNLKRQLGKMLSIALAASVAASCLSVVLGGVLQSEGDAAFRQLIEQHGQNIMNLDIVSGFMNAAGTDDEESLSQSVEQDISGILEQYQDDSRIEGITTLSALHDAVVTVDGKDFIIETSGQAAQFNEMLAGENADNTECEVVLPQVLVEKMGYTNDEVIGRELSFVASVYNWDSGQPVSMPVSFSAKVSGVADTSYVIDILGEPTVFEHEDALFFSLASMKEIYAQAKIQNPNFAFTLHPKTPEDYLSVYDELMSKGIVPLGQVELIRDIVSLKGDTGEQTGISYILIASLSLLAALSICGLISMIRKKQYAIYKLNGYGKKAIVLLNLAEYSLLLLPVTAISVVAAMVLRLSLGLPILLGVGVAFLGFVESTMISLAVKPLIALKTGGR